MEIGWLRQKLHVRMLRVDDAIRSRHGSQDSFTARNGWMVAMGDKLKVCSTSIAIPPHLGEFSTEAAGSTDMRTYCCEIVAALEDWDRSWVGWRPCFTKTMLQSRRGGGEMPGSSADKAYDPDSVIEMHILDLGESVKIVITKMRLGSLREARLSEGGDEICVKTVPYRDNEPSFAYMLNAELDLTIFVIRHSGEDDCVNGVLEIEVPRGGTSKDMIGRVEKLFGKMAAELRRSRIPDAAWKTYKF